MISGREEDSALPVEWNARQAFVRRASGSTSPVATISTTCSAIKSDAASSGLQGTSSASQALQSAACIASMFSGEVKFTHVIGGPVLSTMCRMLTSLYLRVQSAAYGRESAVRHGHELTA
jgi:hypothetical protein